MINPSFRFFVVPLAAAAVLVTIALQSPTTRSAGASNSGVSQEHVTDCSLKTGVCAAVDRAG